MHPEGWGSSGPWAAWTGPGGSQGPEQPLHLVLNGARSPEEEHPETAAQLAAEGSAPGRWRTGGAGRLPPPLISHLPLHKAAPLSPGIAPAASASSPTHSSQACPRPTGVRLVLGRREALTHPDRLRGLHSPGWFPKPSPSGDPGRAALGPLLPVRKGRPTEGSLSRSSTPDTGRRGAGSG